MLPSLILISVLVIVGLVLYLLDGRKAPSPDEADHSPTPPALTCSDDTCGLASVCPSEELLKCESEPVIYFDDEELDAFVGRLPDDYTPEEIDLWRDILYTLRPADLAPWARSIKKRGLVMPAPIHDEYVMLYSEPR